MSGLDWTGDEEGNNRIEKETEDEILSCPRVGYLSVVVVALWAGLEPNKKKGVLDPTGWAGLAWADIVLGRKRSPSSLGRKK
jgi:hypothetical protein